MSALSVFHVTTSPSGVYGVCAASKTEAVAVLTARLRSEEADDSECPERTIQKIERVGSQAGWEAGTTLHY